MVPTNASRAKMHGLSPKSKRLFPISTPPADSVKIHPQLFLLILAIMLADKQADMQTKADT